MNEEIKLRHNSRVLALSSLFCLMFAEEDEIYSSILFTEEVGNLDKDNHFYYQIYNGVKENIEIIDSEIEKYAVEWPLKSLPKVDLCILRIGVYELLFLKGNPKSVVIDEAVELAKEFGNENSSKFVNAVLDKIEVKN